METLTHAGEVYEVTSMYLVPGEAWTYELTAGGGDRGRASLAVLIPDASPGDAPFTPHSITDVQVAVSEGDLPWPILVDFVNLVDASGDLRADDPGVPVFGDLALSRNVWRFADRTFDVNSYHYADFDCWCYELYETTQISSDNQYLEIRIPDRQPLDEPFVPAPADQVTVHIHGSWTLPWPVLHHLLANIASTGDIVTNDRHNTADSER